MVRGCQAPKRIPRSPVGRGSEYGGVYRAELHKRALQWERATAYLAPSKACGVEKRADRSAHSSYYYSASPNATSRVHCNAQPGMTIYSANLMAAISGFTTLPRRSLLALRLVRRVRLR